MVAPKLNHVAVSSGRLAGEAGLVGMEMRKLNFAKAIEPLHVGLYPQGGLVGFLQSIVLSEFQEIAEL